MLSMGTVFHEIILKKPERPTNLVDIEEETENERRELELSEEDKNVSLYENSDEEWDTDLEDAETYGVYTYKQADDPARVVYLAACKRLNIVPDKSFLKGLGTGSINVSHQGLGPKDAKAMSLSLVKDRSTKDLNVAGNMIGYDGIKYICEMLRENDIITHLDLSENDLDSHGAALLAGMLIENDCLHSLNLSGNSFKTRDAEYFAQILALPPVIRLGSRYCLRELDLSHNDFGDEGAMIIGHALADNETISKLSLSWNQIRQAGTECLSKGILENTCLKSLDLSSNGVNNAGAECIAKALVQNRTLEELNLNGNRVGLAGLIHIFKALGTNDCLKILRLTNNPIQLEGPIAALSLLHKSETSILQELEIAHIQWDACVPREFPEMLKTVKSTRPNFEIIHGGFMDYRALCRSDEEKFKNKWKTDPMLVFVNFIEERRLKLFDMFKYFDKDKSCSLSRDEFLDGLKRMSCPLSEKELDFVINVLDVDRNGEVDFGELLEVVDSQRKRLRRLKNKYIRQGSKKDEAQDSQKPPSRPSSRDGTQRSPSRPSSRSRTDIDNQKAIQSKSRPTTPGSSLKRDVKEEASSLNTSQDSSEDSDSSDRKPHILAKGHTVT